MRINAYAEELTNEVRILTADRKGNTFIGVRFIMKSPTDLYDSKTNDDRCTAITLWFADKESTERLMTLALHSLKQS